MVMKRGFIAAALSLAFAAAFAVPAGVAGAAGTGTFRQENLVSDQPGVATLTDPNLVNAWGMSRGPNTPVWVSDNGADVTTLYRGDIPGTPVTQVPLVVSIPGGAPTGQVFNDTTAFTVPGTGNPALFIFAGEDGDLSAWNQLVAPLTSAVAVGHTEGTQPRSREGHVQGEARLLAVAPGVWIGRRNPVDEAGEPFPRAPRLVEMDEEVVRVLHAVGQEDVALDVAQVDLRGSERAHGVNSLNWSRKLLMMVSASMVWALTAKSMNLLRRPRLCRISSTVAPG